MPSKVTAAASQCTEPIDDLFCKRGGLQQVKCIEQGGLECFWFSGENSPECTLKHRWFKEEWFVMLALEATPHLHHLQMGNGCSSFHPAIQWDHSPFPCHTFQGTLVIRQNGRIPSLCMPCLPLQFFELGDRRCFWCLSHALIHVQNVSGIRI